MLHLLSENRYFTTNYFPSEAPGACWCKAGRNIGACVCDLVCVMETMHLQIHSANECEAGTQETPTAVHIQGLMNLSKGK